MTQIKLRYSGIDENFQTAFLCKNVYFSLATECHVASVTLFLFDRFYQISSVLNPSFTANHSAIKKQILT